MCLRSGALAVRSPAHEGSRDPAQRPRAGFSFWRGTECGAVCNYAHGVSVLSFSSNHRLLIGELHLGKLSETVVVHCNAPHDRPRFLVSHLIGNRASFLCTKAPMRRVP